MNKVGRLIEENTDLGSHGIDAFYTEMIDQSTFHYVNETGEAEDFARNAISNGITVDGKLVKDEIASSIGAWYSQISGTSNSGSLFFRNRYTPSFNIFDQIITASDAVENDDILSSVCEALEGLVFNRLSMECVDADQEDLWNQIAEDLDFENYLKQMWRELFKVSQVYVGVRWGQRVYKVRNNSITPVSALDADPTLSVPGSNTEVNTTNIDIKPKATRKRRKQFAVNVPTSLTIFDPSKILVVGQTIFGHEQFAYIATPQEDEAFKNIFRGQGGDPTVLEMFQGPYTPTIKELAYLTQGRNNQLAMAGNLENQPYFYNNHVNLWLFKTDSIFRHTLTKADYERYATVRLKAALPVLDLKYNLRSADRSVLVGASNFIVVIKKGTDKLPGREQEIKDLAAQTRSVARMPILVGDHRLSVEIVTPATDNTLDMQRYATLDQRLIMIALNSFSLSNSDNAKNASVINDGQIARGVEARRSALSRSVTSELLRKAVLKNPGILDEVPNISFRPRRINISINPQLQALIIQLRNQGDISRETLLDEFNLDQSIEYDRRLREKIVDPIFQSSVPFSSPDSNPFQDGTKGGRPVGGGGPGMPSTPASGQSTN